MQSEEKTSWTALGILLILVLLLVTIKTCSAQSYNNNGLLIKKHKVVSDKARFVILATTSIILNGIGDGLNANPNTKPAGHIFTAAAIGTLVATPFLVNYNKRKWYIYALKMMGSSPIQTMVFKA